MSVFAEGFQTADLSAVRRGRRPGEVSRRDGFGHVRKLAQLFADSRRHDEDDDERTGKRGERNGEREQEPAVASGEDTPERTPSRAEERDERHAGNHRD